MSKGDLIKYERGLIKQVSNAISVTNKLLAVIAPQLIPYRKKDKWGFCTPDKKIVINCEFDKVEEFSESVAVVNRLGKYGFVARNGKITNNGLLRHFDRLLPLKEGMARASYFSNKSKWGYVNKNNSEVVGFIYDIVSDFCEGLAQVKVNSKWGVIDKTNLVVVPFIYDIIHAFSDGLANVRIGEKWGMIDKTGKMIIQVKVNSLEELDSLTGNTEKSIYPKIIETSNKYSIIDKNDKQLNKIFYDYIDNRGFGFYNDLIDVRKNGKCGFIDKKGIEIIPCIYDDVYPFFEGIAAVSKDDYWGFIDAKGNEIISLIYEGVSPFSNGIAKIETERKGNWIEGYINKDGVEYWED